MPVGLPRVEWVTVKEAAGLRGRTTKTVRTWVRLSLVRIWREPGGRVLIFLPDVQPPADVPALEDAAPRRLSGAPVCLSCPLRRG